MWDLTPQALSSAERGRPQLPSWRGLEAAVRLRSGLSDKDPTTGTNQSWVTGRWGLLPSLWAGAGVDRAGGWG